MTPLQHYLPAIESLVWGDLDPQQNPSIRVEVSLHQALISDRITCGISVEVPPLGEQETRKFNLRETYSPPRTKSLEDALGGVVLAMVPRLSPRLFEYDPRKGMPFSAEFPACPLFDPHEWKSGIRTYIQMSQRDQVWEAVDPTLGMKLARVIGTCALCGQRNFAFRLRDPVVWGGGNVGFVHSRCASWL